MLTFQLQGDAIFFRNIVGPTDFIRWRVDPTEPLASDINLQSLLKTLQIKDDSDILDGLYFILCDHQHGSKRILDPGCSMNELDLLCPASKQGQIIGLQAGSRSMPQKTIFLTANPFQFLPACSFPTSKNVSHTADETGQLESVTSVALQLHTIHTSSFRWHFFGAALSSPEMCAENVDFIRVVPNSHVLEAEILRLQEKGIRAVAKPNQSRWRRSWGPASVAIGAPKITSFCPQVTFRVSSLDSYMDALIQRKKQAHPMSQLHISSSVALHHVPSPSLKREVRPVPLVLVGLSDVHVPVLTQSECGFWKGDETCLGSNHSGVNGVHMGYPGSWMLDPVGGTLYIPNQAPDKGQGCLKQPMFIDLYGDDSLDAPYMSHWEVTFVVQGSPASVTNENLGTGGGTLQIVVNGRVVVEGLGLPYVHSGLFPSAELYSGGVSVELV